MKSRICIVRGRVLSLAAAIQTHSNSNRRLTLQRLIQMGVTGSLILLANSNHLVAQPISLADIQILQEVPASPSVDNDRGDSGDAFDGSAGTWSFLTPSGTVSPNIVAMDLGSAMMVNRIRVDKFGDTDDGGAASGAPGIAPVDHMDLEVLFTTDLGALITRSYTPVSALTNGFGGAELIDADAVGGSMVDNDRHDGIYSLSFDSVLATGIGLVFSRDAGDSQPFTHYRAREIELFRNATALPIAGHQVFTAPTPKVVQLDNRGDEDKAIDGETGTWSFLTPSGTTGERIAAVDLGGSEQVNRLRVAKWGDTDDGGSGAGAPGIAPIDNMDLQILFTTDTGPLESREYAPVGGLTNGFGGTELINADAVNAVDATVDNDHHDFSADGWYSLTFDAVDATGLAILFSRDAGDSSPFTHYRTFEIEVHRVSPATLPGDANNDRQVTGADLISVQQHFGTIDPNLPTDGMFLGDADDDGVVSGADLISVQQNFGQVLTAPLGPVPEPATMALWVFAHLGFWRRRYGG